MKKILIVVMFVFCLCSCYNEHPYKVHVKYDVCWPDKTITYDTIIDCAYSGTEEELAEKFKVFNSSSRGTNYLTAYPGYNILESTTAPIRLQKYELIK